MTRRELPRAEWARLAHTELGPALAYLPPGTRISVVEQLGAIVGVWGLLPYWHAEGLWIAPEHRGRGRVGAYLLAGLRETAAAADIDVVLTAAITPAIDTLIRHYGGRQLPGTHYALPIGGR